jgi:hypothetical protein
MTPKERILHVMNKLPENAISGDAIYRLEFLQSIEEGLMEAEQGLGIEHDEVFRQLLKQDAENKTIMDAPGSKKSPRNKTVQGRRFAR